MDIQETERPLEDSHIFVFGSNLAGRHGKGAALYALKHFDAIYGQGWGRQGRAYGIPTKDENLRTLPLEEIHNHVLEFLDYAYANPQETFFLTAIGCGLAGYKPTDISWMFKKAPSNVLLPEVFIDSAIK